jgi:hypothetical protein
VPLLLLLTVAALAALYIFYPHLYAWILRLWGVQAYRTPFLDWQAIVTALECKRQGLDVMRTNPCDPLGRMHIYSPLWLAPADFLPITRQWVLPTGIALELGFIAALWRVPIAAAKGAAFFFAAAVFSSATVYALERGNNDLVIFLLVIGAMPLLAARWPARAGFYAIVMLAALLKYYPIVLLIFALRETPRRLAAVVLASLAALALFYFAYRTELAENAAAINDFATYFDTDSFGFANLPFGIVSLIPALGAIGVTLGAGPHLIAYLFLAALLFDVVSRGWKVSTNAELGGALAKLPAREIALLIAGTMLIAGCFFAGRNVLYRGIFFILTIPGLYALSAGAKDPFAARWAKSTLWFVLFLMWSECFRLMVEGGAALLPPGRLAMGIPAVFWGLKELIWWRVVAVFVGLLLAFVADTPIGSWIFARLPQRWRPNDHGGLAEPM